MSGAVLALRRAVQAHLAADAGLTALIGAGFRDKTIHPCEAAHRIAILVAGTQRYGVLEQFIDCLVPAESFDRQIVRTQFAHRQTITCDRERAVGVERHGKRVCLLRRVTIL